MPRIPKMNQARNVSNRVQNINLDRTGVGASARALSDIGEGVASFSDMLLQKRKEAQAVNYNHNKAVDKTRTRTDFLFTLKSHMNEENGILNIPADSPLASYNGKAYADAVSEFEQEYDRRAIEEAPTDLAREGYKREQNRNTRTSILQADVYQHQTIAKTQKKRDYTKSELRAKELSSLSTYTDEYNAIDLAEKDLKLNNEYYGKSNPYYTQSEREDQNRITNNMISKSALDSALDLHKDYTKPAKALMFSMFEKPESLYDLVSDVTNDEISFHKRGVGGELIYYNTKGQKKLIVDDKQGLNFVIPEKTEIGAKAINIEAIKKSKDGPKLNIEPSEIDKSLTPPEKMNYLRRIFKLAKQEDNQKASEIMDRFNNLVTLASSNDEILNSDTTPEERRQKYFNLAVDIEKYIKDDNKKNKMLIQLASAPMVGSMKEQIKNLSDVDANNLIKGIRPSQLINSDMSSILPIEQDLVDNLLSDPEFVTNITKANTGELTRYANSVRVQQLSAPADHGVANDKRISMLFDKTIKSGSPKDFDNLVTELDRYQDKLRIPQDKRDFLPDALIGSYKQTFDNFLNNNDSVSSAKWLYSMNQQWGDHAPRVMSELSKAGLNPNYAWAGFVLQSKAPDIYSSARIIENVKVQEHLDSQFKEKLPDVRKSVRARVADQGLGFLRASNAVNLFGDNVRTSEALLNILELDVMRQIHDNSYRDLEYNKDKNQYTIDKEKTRPMVKRALERLQKSFTIVGPDKKTFLMPNYVLEKNNISNEDIKYLDEKLTDPKFVKKNVDLEKTLEPMLDKSGIPYRVYKKNNPEEYKKFLINTFMDPNFMGKDQMDYNAKEDRIDILKKTPDGVPVPVYDKNGNILGSKANKFKNYVEDLRGN